MKSIFISDLTAGSELINEPLMVQDLVQRTTKDDRPYILCTLRDKTGQMSGVFWNVPDYILSWIRVGAVGLTTGRVSNYKDSLQITITDLNPIEQPDMRDFLPASERPQEEMIAELKEVINSLNDPWQQMVHHLFLADEKQFSQIVNAPAARVMHHAYVGGLLEHTLSMARIAEMLIEHYPYVNRDLLLSGVLLHDIGKISEYTVQGTFQVDEDGLLVGHVTRAVIWIEQTAVTLNFPQDKLRHLVHLIASHHGKKEWGAPVEPKTLEAVLLHQIDLLDSRVQGFLEHVKNDGSLTQWTAQPSRMFGSNLYRPEGMPAPIE